MEERGVVVKTDKNFATVKVDKKSECDKCGMCAFPKGAGYAEFYADNAVGAKVGDEVIVKTSESAKTLGIVLVFLVPLLLIGLSALITFTLINKEIFVLIISAATVTAWFCVLAIIDKKLKSVNALSSEITRIITDKGKEKQNGN